MVVTSKEILKGIDFIKACRDPERQRAILDALNERYGAFTTQEAQEAREASENGGE